MSSTNTLGKYEIVREIARSNDVVYEAIDPTLGRRVALKELYLAGNLSGAQKRERIERFLREGKAAGQLSHPNIVTIFDVGQEGDRFYIAMEYLEGQTLRDTMQVGGALPVQEATDIMVQLCSALAYAHSHSVVHRDVKPENVQILPGGHVKLTDFGIARIMSEPSITANGQVFGTPSYMSPEQVSGKGIDGRSDIFSCGVMLYEMLAGHKPFSGDTVVTITYNIMNSEPAPIPSVPPYVMAAINRAMAKDPNMRFQTVEQFVDQLKNPPVNGATVYGDPFGAPMGQSCGGSQPDPFGQAQPTTYAPPQYSPSAQLVPDPFAHAPAPPAPPPMARQPLLSPETRAFLGVLFVVMGLAGMLVFAIWVTREAYNKYTESTAGRVVDQYISQGDKLYKDGRLNEALEQYKQAAKASEGNKSAAATAKRRLSITCAELAKQSYGSGDYAKALALAKDAVNADPSYDLAHYRLGVASLSANQREVAEKEFKAAVDIGGTTDTAKTARTYLSQLYMEDAANLRSRGDAAGARKKYQEVIDLGDADYMLKAQEELSRT